MISRKKALWPVLIVLILAVLAMARLFSAPAGPEGQSGKPGEKSANGGKIVPKQLEVAYLVLKPQPLARKVLSSGTLLAREEVDLKSEASGRIVGLHFKEGTKVRKGDLLVKINDADIKAQLRKIANQLKLSEAREFRQGTLAARDLVSKEEYEIAVSEKNSLLADRDMLQAQLAKTEIHAPFDGVVGLKEISEGSNIASGTRIAGLFSLDPLKIDFSIPEQYFGQAKAGDSILIAVEGLAKPVKGTVYAIEPKVDAATRMLRIRGYCPNGDGLIPPGASARVELPLRVIPDAILVPSNAVMPDIRGQKVMLYKGGKALAVPVTSPYRAEDRIQIAGVAAGDTLITSGLIQLKSGSQVKLAEARPEAGGD
ncbi:MAG TPA: efflux RND transporter periplasmic adaptor subunit [Fibrobacteria bacterium]|nr:efflux RND transporter periplasmic adaptor subunit [Fibrobacteria bacterium]